jgi:hypothetical protein
MNDDDLVLISDSLYQKSQKLLSTFDFLNIAKKYFKKVDLVGSAANNLMLDADMDIDCQVEKIDKNIILKFVGELLSLKECKKVILYNHILDEKSCFIVNIEKFDFEGEKWIITFFIATHLGDSATLVNWVKENLTEEKRKTILMFKKYREENKQKKSIPSHIIYKAVIEGNVENIESFKKYLSENGIDPNEKDEIC